jgi:hypothetical protein
MWVSSIPWFSNQLAVTNAIVGACVIIYYGCYVKQIFLIKIEILKIKCSGNFQKKTIMNYK